MWRDGGVAGRMEIIPYHTFGGSCWGYCIWAEGFDKEWSDCTETLSFTLR